MRTLESLEIIRLMAQEPIVEPTTSSIRKAESPIDTTRATKPERVNIHKEEIAEVATKILGKDAKIFTGGRGISAILTTTSSIPPDDKSHMETHEKQDQEESIDNLVSMHSTPQPTTDQSTIPAIDTERLKRIEAVNVANMIGKPVARELSGGITLVTRPSNPFKK